MQQLSGVNALSCCLPTLLVELVGVSSSYARLLAGANASVYLVAAFLCLVLVDLIGRRKLMMYGPITTGTRYFVAPTALREASLHPENKSDLGKVPWVYKSEINSLGWRTRGAAAAATATICISGFATIQLTKVGVDNLGWGFYLLFAAICWLFLPIIYPFYPETSLRTLEDMDEIFEHHSGLFVFRDKTLTSRNRPQAFAEAERRRITETSPLAEAFRSV
ncbi:hypothetical protein F5Y11DRAFT_131857 [Daldinia sp. FL1419]|nr:hypothetical protein F5Y11DRAFT_131857 [Daldinia sp. FL1419]